MCECAKMLKACWDCAIGSVRDSEREGPYGERLNGVSTQFTQSSGQPQPPWPTPQYDNEIMFLLPRPLKVGDSIDVTGTIRSNPQAFFVNLVTGEGNVDYQNIACQLAVNFNTNDVSLKVIQNGQNDTVFQEPSASDMFGDPNLEVTFSVNINSNPNGEVFMDVLVGGSHLEQISLRHDLNRIRYLTLSGDVEKVNKLTFQMN